jgi:tetratricopeptide (TPR) repeat protein
VYPPIYFSLKKTDLWSPSLKKPVKQGLEAAVAQKIALREAFHAFSSILSEEKNWEGALTYCQKAMQIQTFENKPRDYLRLGLLYLRNDKSQEAASAFARGMHMSRERSRDFETIYGYYKELGRPDQFHSFYQQVSHYFRLPYEAQILKARSLIDQEQYTLAKQILKNLNQQEPHAESYYWLARIGEKEQDYDAMELAIQKATVLDPKNSRYHLLFSKALRYVKKFDRAEREARLALEHSTTLNPWLFNHRAWIRWAQKNYAGAISDWQTAIHLKPDKACFYAYTAEAYRKEGRQILAREYYEKALKFDPKNEKYKKRLHELLTEGA